MKHELAASAFKEGSSLFVVNACIWLRNLTGFCTTNTADVYTDTNGWVNDICKQHKGCNFFISPIRCVGYLDVMLNFGFIVTARVVEHCSAIMKKVKVFEESGLAVDLTVTEAFMLGVCEDIRMDVSDIKMRTVEGVKMDMVFNDPIKFRPNRGTESQIKRLDDTLSSFKMTAEKIGISQLCREICLLDSRAVDYTTSVEKFRQAFTSGSIIRNLIGYSSETIRIMSRTAINGNFLKMSKFLIAPHLTVGERKFCSVNTIHRWKGCCTAEDAIVTNIKEILLGVTDVLNKVVNIDYDMIHQTFNYIASLNQIGVPLDPDHLLIKKRKMPDLRGKQIISNSAGTVIGYMLDSRIATSVCKFMKHEDINTDVSLINAASSTVATLIDELNNNVDENGMVPIEMADKLRKYAKLLSPSKSTSLDVFMPLSVVGSVPLIQQLISNKLITNRFYEADHVNMSNLHYPEMDTAQPFWQDMALLNNLDKDEIHVNRTFDKYVDSGDYDLSLRTSLISLASGNATTKDLSALSKISDFLHVQTHSPNSAPSGLRK
jgi:hypothetical protein